MSKSSSEVAEKVPWQCFSAIQSRKFLLLSSPSCAPQSLPVPFQLAALCPSMDLVLVESPTSSSSTSLVIYRTLSWQRVATINPTTNTNTNTSTSTSTTNSVENSTTSKLCYCWSPNGQWVAVAASSTLGEGIISLYGVENLHLGGGVTGNSSYAGSGPTGSSGPTDAQHSWSIPTADSNIIQAMHWLHVGRNHPSACEASRTEYEQEISWR